MSESAVLITGGAGYVGSHAAARLLRAGRRVVIVDSLVTGHKQAVERLESIAPGRVIFHQADIADTAAVAALLRGHNIRAVMHFAALTLVGRSVQEPLAYYRNNAGGMNALLEACVQAGVERFLFSSSCAVYGEPAAEHVPITEGCPRGPVSPYGRTKLHGEEMLADVARACAQAGKPWSHACLRYFNVAGCDRSGLLGEDHDPETHLIPSAIRAAMGLREPLAIFGTDYPTPDGTCVRDYIHAEDLAEAHAQVLDALEPGEERVYNLGIGRGHSVREILGAVGRVSGRRLDVREEPRRAGDPAVLLADPSKISRELGWKASVTDLDEMIDSAWRWFQKHPRGYRS